MAPSIILLLALVAHPALATLPNTDPESIDAIIVTASRMAIPESDLAPSVDYITGEQIERRNPSSVVELLRQFSGVNIIQQGGRGGLASVVIRGGESNFTVVLIDGVKVNDPSNSRGGSYDFSNLALDNITRVELVRGPLSSVYGSDALAGVIQISTTNMDPGGKLRLQIGNSNFMSGSIGFSRQFSEMFAWIDTHAVRDVVDLTSSSYDDWGISGGLQSLPETRSQASVVFRYQHSDSTGFPEDSGGPKLAVLRDVDRRQSNEAHLRFTWDVPLANGWDINMASAHYERSESFFSPGIESDSFVVVPPNSADAEFSRDQVTATLRRGFHDFAVFAIGAEWQSEFGDSDGVLDFGFPVPTNFQLRRDTISIYSEISIDAGPVTVQGSLRWDDVDENGSEETARLGMLYRLSDGRTELRVNWGQGFKAPSFFALAHPLVGNPELRPEFANSFDVMVSHRLFRETGEISLSVFRNKYTDLIDFDPNLFTTVNRSKVITRGVELNLALRLSERVHFRGHLTYSASDIIDSAANLRGRPKWRGGMIVDWTINENWLLLASALVLDSFHDSSIPTGSILLDGYERVDVSVTWQANDGLSFRFAVDNLLDSEYQEAIGFPATRVRGRIGVRYAF